MENKTRDLTFAYGVIAAGALVATWTQNIRHFMQDDSGGVWGFFTDTYANPAAASFANDLAFVCVAAFVFFWIEGRRLGIPHLWAYYALTAVAISVAFPLFLLARQQRLAALGPDAALR